MCGIVGIYSRNSDPECRSQIASVLQELAHRGPDGQGIVQVGPVVFGHRRLSIIDLSGGAQPMWSHDDTLLLTFNGEIFNYCELRDQLPGASFRTRSDTEVILEAYRAWGEEAFARFNGQFALALYDTGSQRMILARDGMGEKPLYYSEFNGEILFGSELKSVRLLLSLRKRAARINRRALIRYLSLNYVPFDDTLVEQIHTIAPGALLIVDAAKQNLRPKRDAPIATTVASLPEACEILEGLLDRAVELRLRSDVPVGMFLSGGIDSTLLATSIAKHSTNQRAFIADFKQPGFSERSNAELVCRQLGIPFETVEIDPDPVSLPDLIEDLVFHGDEPLADSSALPVFLLCKQTAQRVKVVLSGEGGDELFGGYLTYRASLLANRIPRPLAGVLQRLSPFASWLPRGADKVGIREMGERFFRNLDLPAYAAHLAWNGMWRDKEKAAFLSTDLQSELSAQDTFIEVAQGLGLGGKSLSIESLLRADQAGYLVNDILAKTDRMSMAHGLEVRPAMMDPDIVAFSRALPGSLQASLMRNKIVPKALLAKVAPWYPHRARKQGFSIPVHLWFRTKLRSYMDDLLRSPFVRESGLFNIGELLKRWEDHLAERRNIGFELWGIMVLLVWMRRFRVGL